MNFLFLLQTYNQILFENKTSCCKIDFLFELSKVFEKKMFRSFKLFDKGDGAFRVN